MFKPGIWRRDDLFRARTWLGHSRLPAYTLMRYAEPADESSIRCFEKVITGVRLGSGVYRTTYRGRFAELNEFVEPLVRQYFTREQALSVHDWAVSDGLTSMQWATSLHQIFPALTFSASDYIFQLIEASDNQRERFILEPSGALLQYISPPFVLPMAYDESRLYVLNRWLKQWARRKLRGLTAAMRSIAPDMWTDAMLVRGGKWTFRPLSLVHPEVQTFARENAWFSLRQHDAFSRWPMPCDVLRTMNLYNWGYFPEEQLMRGIRAAIDSVVAGGLWIVGRTQEADCRGEHDATVFRKHRTSVEVVGRLGRCSEIEDLVFTTQAARFPV
jgi:hypothetical protein